MNLDISTTSVALAVAILGFGFSAGVFAMGLRYALARAVEGRELLKMILEQRPGISLPEAKAMVESLMRDTFDSGGMFSLLETANQANMEIAALRQELVKLHRQMDSLMNEQEQLRAFRAHALPLLRDFSEYGVDGAMMEKWVPVARELIRSSED